MTLVGEINVSIVKLEAKRANVLAKIKADMKLWSFKTSEFKGVLLTRLKRCPNKAKAVKSC